LSRKDAYVAEGLRDWPAEAGLFSEPQNVRLCATFLRLASSHKLSRRALAKAIRLRVKDIDDDLNRLVQFGWIEPASGCHSSRPRHHTLTTTGGGMVEPLREALDAARMKKLLELQVQADLLMDALLARSRDLH
jgi:DNA-binding MarR family transcriptional regulator